MGFSKFNLNPALFDAVTKLGFAEPTPVQNGVIPEALKGSDIRASAQTGTGKTCAFVIPILNALLSHTVPPRLFALIILPTRELAVQVEEVIHNLSKNSKIKTALILGGMNFERQEKQIKSGANIVIATPGRLLDHMSQNIFNLRHTQIVVLDEADRMLDMGFLPDIRYILSHCPSARQTMLFSATFPQEIESLSNQFLKDPFVVKLSHSNPSDNINQLIYPVSRSQKEAFMQALLEKGNITSAIVFCRTKQKADEIGRRVQQWGKTVAVIHSDRSQAERTKAIEEFRKKAVQILVATDIAARGIDVKDISHVINFDTPEHSEDYVHRIGRTGRAQALGDAITLVSPDEEPYLKRIEKLIGKTIPRGVLPDFPYLVQPHLMLKGKSIFDSFGGGRRRIPLSGRRFR